MKNFTPRLTKATLLDYPTIQNMARFYVYEMSRECGLNDKDWAMPLDGLYESFDFKKYFTETHREAMAYWRIFCDCAISKKTYWTAHCF